MFPQATTISLEMRLLYSREDAVRDESPPETCPRKMKVLSSHPVQDRQALQRKCLASQKDESEGLIRHRRCNQPRLPERAKTQRSDQ